MIEIQIEILKKGYQCVLDFHLFFLIEGQFGCEFYPRSLCPLSYLYA